MVEVDKEEQIILSMEVETLTLAITPRASVQLNHL